MGIGDRISIIVGNVAMMFPVYILLLVTAIMSSIGQSHLDKLAKTSSTTFAYNLVQKTTIALWILFAGGLVFSFTFGLFIIPAIVSIPYLYGGIMILFAILNMYLAGTLFYGANAARISDEFKNGNTHAKESFKTLVICGILMVVTSVFMFGYSMYTMTSYNRQGGVTGDIAMIADAGQIAAPQFAPILGVVGAAAKQNLSTDQQAENQARAAQLNQLGQLNVNPNNLAGLLQNPQAVALLKQALA